MRWNYLSIVTITYPIPNFNGCTVEVCYWISNFIWRFTEHASFVILETHIPVHFKWNNKRCVLLHDNLSHSIRVLDQGELTDCGWVTHTCSSELTIIGSDNGLSPGRRQAIIWTNAGILLIRNLGTSFSSRKCFWKCRLRNGGNLVSSSMI